MGIINKNNLKWHRTFVSHSLHSSAQLSLTPSSGRISLILLTSPSGHTRSPWVVAVTGSSRCTPTTVPTPSLTMVFSTSSPPLPTITSVTTCSLVTSTCGAVNSATSAQAMLSMAARETLLPPATTSTPSNPPVSAQLASSASSMERLRSELSYPRVTPSGLPFGCFPPMRRTLDGQHLARSTSWNLVVMMPLAKQVATTSSPPHF